MVLLLIMSLVLIGLLWLRFDTLTGRVGQTQEQLLSWLRNYDELLIEMQLLKQRVALLEKPVPAPPVEETTPATEPEQVAEQTVFPEPTPLPIEPDITIEQIVVPTFRNRQPFRRLCPRRKHPWRSPFLSLPSRASLQPADPEIGKK